MCALFDTHAHLTDEAFAPDIADVLRRMGEAGVTRAICVGADLPSSKASVAFAQEHANVYAAVGIHPHDADTWSLDAKDALCVLAKDAKVKAIGEIGLDYHYDADYKELQKQVFMAQIELAQALALPVILHIREAHGDALTLLKTHAAHYIGVLHCFSGSMESAKEYLKLGFHISFTGSVTFKNAVNLAQVAKEIPPDRIMVETDCPYLAPVPLRGKRNEPANVARIARFLAELRGVELDAFAAQTTRNACALFNIPT